MVQRCSGASIGHITAECHTGSTPRSGTGRGGCLKIRDSKTAMEMDWTFKLASVSFSSRRKFVVVFLSMVVKDTKVPCFFKMSCTNCSTFFFYTSCSRLLHYHNNRRPTRWAQGPRSFWMGCLYVKGPLSAMAENQWVAGVKNPILIGAIFHPLL